LKTPLATLAIAASTEDRRDPATLQQLVAQMERRIRHHLGRARMAALDGAVRVQTQIAPRLQDLGDVLGTIHSDRSITFSMDVPADLAVACEQQDFDEMAGNLLDNAFMWTTKSVRVDASRGGAMVHILVDDDGPGLRFRSASRRCGRASVWMRPRRALALDCRSLASWRSFTAVASLWVKHRSEGCVRY